MIFSSHISFDKQDVAERTLRTVVDSTQTLRRNLEKEGERVSPKIEATLKAIYDSSLKTVNELKTTAETAVNSIQKKN